MHIINPISFRLYFSKSWGGRWSSKNVRSTQALIYTDIHLYDFLNSFFFYFLINFEKNFIFFEDFELIRGGMKENIILNLYLFSPEIMAPPKSRKMVRSNLLLKKNKKNFKDKYKSIYAPGYFFSKNLNILNLFAVFFKKNFKNVDSYLGQKKMLFLLINFNHFFNYFQEISIDDSRDINSLISKLPHFSVFYGNKQKKKFQRFIEPLIKSFITVYLYKLFLSKKSLVHINIFWLLEPRASTLVRFITHYLNRFSLNKIIYTLFGRFSYFFLLFPNIESVIIKCSGRVRKSRRVRHKWYHFGPRGSGVSAKYNLIDFDQNEAITRFGLANVKVWVRLRQK